MLQAKISSGIHPDHLEALPDYFYSQGKRGIEKPPFDLPDFIKKTGIMEMREALQEKEELPLKMKSAV